MNIKWSNGRGTCSIDDIMEFEQTHKINFPQNYKNLALTSNGAFPDKNIFDIENRKECVFEALLNWDKSRKANIFFWVDVLGNDRIIPFGRDPFGNAICFDFSISKDPTVKFWDHETGKFNDIANTFEGFLEKLRI